MTTCETHPTKILVVDDSATVRIRVGQLLASENATVIQAENGRQGVELFHAEEPDCVLLDYVMPDMNGIEVLDCLQRVARSIAQMVRGVDLTGRYGGEEFTVLLPQTSLDGAQTLAARIREAVYDLNVTHPASPTADRVTVSLGVAAGPDERWEDLVQEADKALYQAKRTGRNRVCVRENQVCLGGSR